MDENVVEQKDGTKNTYLVHSQDPKLLESHIYVSKVFLRIGLVS